MELFLPLVVRKVHYSKLYGQKYLVLLIPNKGNVNATASFQQFQEDSFLFLHDKDFPSLVWQNYTGLHRALFDPIQHLQPNHHFKCCHWMC